MRMRIVGLGTTLSMLESLVRGNIAGFVKHVIEPRACAWFRS